MVLILSTMWVSSSIRRRSPGSNGRTKKICLSQYECGLFLIVPVLRRRCDCFGHRDKNTEYQDEGFYDVLDEVAEGEGEGERKSRKRQEDCRVDFEQNQHHDQCHHLCGSVIKPRTLNRCGPGVEYRAHTVSKKKKKKTEYQIYQQNHVEDARENSSDAAVHQNHDTVDIGRKKTLYLSLSARLRTSIFRCLYICRPVSSLLVFYNVTGSLTNCSA